MRYPETDWLAKWAVYTPDRLFLRDHETGREWTYGEAQGRALAAASLLRDRAGIARGDRVAVYAANCCEYVFLFLACVKLGAVLLPLNHRLTPPELTVMIRDAEPGLLVFGPEFSPGVDALGDLDARPSALPLSALAEAVWEPLREPADFVPDRPGRLDDLVMILYTSGTTGTPKGAMIDHRMLLWNSINTALRLDLTSRDHSLSFAPFFHTGGWNVLFTPFLHTGASHTLLKKFDPGVILDLVTRERVSILFGVPTMMQMLADVAGFDACDLSSLRYAIVGGAPMPVPLINRWHDRGVFIRQGYGLTEVGPNCYSLHQDHAIRKRGSIGFPNFYIEARVVDGEGRECGPEDIGELWLRSEVVTPGYWRNPEATAGAITDGWFHTGDMVRRDAEGFTFVMDRKKNMYISGGENVYPAEVEATLDAHAAIRESAVVGVPHAKWGETGHAFLVLAEGRSVTAEAVAAFCAERLAKFKIPKHFTFVAELPRNDAGKTDRRALKQLVNSSEERQDP
jgi:fatty-acyl-CoA synthase